LNGDTREAACQVYSQNAWEAMTEGSGGERPWIEYGYYPDFVVHWLALWACYLFAEQHTVNLNVEINICILNVTNAWMLEIIILITTICFNYR
jgi:hypothetical protein